MQLNKTHTDRGAAFKGLPPNRKAAILEHLELAPEESARAGLDVIRKNGGEEARFVGTVFFGVPEESAPEPKPEKAKP